MQYPHFGCRGKVPPVPVVLGSEQCVITVWKATITERKGRSCCEPENRNMQSHKQFDRKMGGQKN